MARDVIFMFVAYCVLLFVFGSYNLVTVYRKQSETHRSRTYSRIAADTRNFGPQAIAKPTSQSSSYNSHKASPDER